MPISFPSNPSVNDTYTNAGFSWTWDGKHWNKLIIGSSLPSQTGNSGKYLTTNGSTISWATVVALPTQTSNSGKYLTTDGTTASWATVPITDVSSLTTKISTSGTIRAVTPFYINGQIISADYTIPAGFNAMTAGPVTIANNITVTVPDGSTWTVV
jgi:hypothetical protein